MSNKQIKIKLEGIGAGLMMHDSRLVDPLNPISKKIAEISARSKKTTDSNRELARLEFLGGLWLNEDNRIVVKAEALEASLCKCAYAVAGKAVSKDKMAASAMCLDSPVLIYDGPDDPEKLWETDRFVSRLPVKIGKARIMRTRPLFRKWSAVAVFDLDTGSVNEDVFIRIAEHAGQYVGIGDYRPRYGRFVVEKV